MKSSDGSHRPRGFIILCVAVIAFASLPLLSGARPRAVTTSVSIVNNSSKQIRNAYTSHVDSDDWSADLLGDATIAAGQSYDVNNIACDGGQIKLIAEDEDGCFLSVVVSCGSSSTWTITNSTARDCGY